jgi:hypothetical protein
METRQELTNNLRQKRDELKLQLHLASMEAKEQWEELEEKWERFAAEARLTKTSESVEESLKLLGDELAKGYEQLKAALSRSKS